MTNHPTTRHPDRPTPGSEEAWRHAAWHNTPCQLDHDTDWPYPCQAQQDHPNHAVTVCRTHNVWWHHPRH